MLNLYRIEHGYDGHGVSIEINTELLSIDYMKATLDFFTGGDDLIDDCNGNIEKAFAFLVAEYVLSHYQLTPLYRMFEDAEGYCFAKIDGSDGVRIFDFDEPEFYVFDDITLMGSNNHV